LFIKFHFCADHLLRVGSGKLREEIVDRVATGKIRPKETAFPQSEIGDNQGCQSLAKSRPQN
jgi:hypothetical protein